MGLVRAHAKVFGLAYLVLRARLHGRTIRLNGWEGYPEWDT